MNLDRLKEIRKDQKLSQENIARALDISLRSYQMKEKGSNSFTFDEVIKIANALNMGEIEFIREIL
ncbi:XRE family transcriptional regulator (plasmid) [Paraclostridium bifermentans]|uniref:XRE family transcriptional regulator n=1 Tax=Paraclostridium bifermentans TaxID=1490 RepID=A0A5P3XKG6_PARBF|nr:helix-turn-helix transcriptional regulator [Paraclostridium bifermentans]QEZ70868.1 XRE family transcriptional regulator [Paraclostridium bifermentans]